MPPYRIEMPDATKLALGQMIVQWSHLDGSLTTTLRILLGEAGAVEIANETDHLRTGLTARVDVYRRVAKALYDDKEKQLTNKALDKVCNVRAKREHLIHGGITPQEDGRLLVQFLEERKDGKVSGSSHWYTAESIAAVAEQMAQADGELGDAFSSYMKRKGPAAEAAQ